MPNYKKIFHQISINYIIKIFSILTSFFFFVTITRALSPIKFGIFSIFSTIIPIITHTLSLNIKDFFIKDFARLKNKVKLNKLKSVTVLTKSLSLFLILFIYIFRLHFLRFLGLQAFEILFVLCLIIAFIKILFNPIGTFLISEKKLNLKNIYELMITKGWMIIVILYFFLFNSLNLDNIFLIQAMYLFTLFLFVLGIFIQTYKYNIYLSNEIDLKYFKNAFFYSLPLITLFLSKWVITASDRFFLKYFHTASEVGNYSYFYSLLSFTTLFSVVISEISFPYLADEYKMNGEKFDKLFNFVIKYTYLILLPILFGLYGLKEEIITLISGPKYLESISMLSILIFFPVFKVSINILHKPLLLNNRTKLIAKIYIFGMILNLIFNYFLIPKYNYYGAAIATISSYIVMFFIFFNVAKKLFNLNYKFIKLGRILFSCVIMYISIIFFNPNVITKKIMIIFFGAGVYILSIFMMKVLDKSEIAFLNQIIKINNVKKHP